MTRTFRHDFYPYYESPIAGANAELTIAEIEDAGLREVLQTPGATLGSWAMLEGLLAPTGDCTPFVFREPLGHAREVKVALSGLFGRFVARAYLQRYFNLSIFAHVTDSHIVLDGRLGVETVRRAPGDLPDWIACTSDLSGLTIAEAKGSHALSGPEQALDRAWNQATRIDIVVAGGRATVKRLAIATRWGVATGGPAEPWISVHDPIDEGDEIGAEEERATYVGVLRHHIANMLAPLGYTELANSIRQLANQSDARGYKQGVRQAHQFLEMALLETSLRTGDYPLIDDWLGRIVTRSGPLPSEGVPRAVRRTLASLDLRPVFVGLERRLVHAAIDGDATSIVRTLGDGSTTPRKGRTDRAGSWIIPLDDGAQEDL